MSIETATSNNIIFNIRDTVGNVISDNIIEAFKIEMNTQTKQISCYIPHKLIVNSVNIIDELGTKVNTTSLSSYAQRKSNICRISNGK